jgi:hypothetical protein
VVVPAGSLLQFSLTQPVTVAKEMFLEFGEVSAIGPCQDNEM